MCSYYKFWYQCTVIYVYMWVVFTRLGRFISTKTEQAKSIHNFYICFITMIYMYLSKLQQLF